MKTMLMILCSLWLLTGSVFAQVEQSGFVKTRNGILVVSNEPGNCYTMEIKGNDIKPIPDRPFWFTVDGKFLQVVNAEKSQFLTPSELKSDDKAVLSAHMKWESDYISETLRSKLALHTAWLTLTNAKTAISWACLRLPRSKRHGVNCISSP